MIRTASPVPNHLGVALKPTSRTFEDRAAADAYAFEKRSYVAPAIKYDEKTEEETRLWFVPL